MNRTIGIDFGTTNTLVSWYDPEKREPKLIRLGKEMDKIPTSIYIDENGNFLCGEDAEDQMQNSPDFPRYSSGKDFKLKLGESSPCISVEMKSFSALDLTTEFLKYIKKRCEEDAFMGEPVSDAVITEPVSFSAARSRDLKKAAQDAGFTTVTLLRESEAAGLAFAKLKQTEKFNRMMIVDWGGGTVDFAMISKDSDGEIHSNPNAIGGDNSLGGEVIDDLLREYLTKKIASSDQKKRNPEDEPAEFKNRMIKEIRRCKEHLSKKSEIKLVLPSEKESYKTIVSRDEINGLITDKINDVVEKLNKLLQNKKIGQEPDALLMIGGTSNIPLIQKTLEKIKLDEKRTLECKHWEHANDAVALGAALYSMRSMHSSDHPSKNITCPVCDQKISIPSPAGNEKIHCPQCKYEFMIQPAVPTVQEILENPSQLNEVEKAAERGNSDAQFLLGSLYCDGIIVDCDPEKGFGWCKKAAAAGNIFAKFYLARHYYEGDGVKKDTVKAEKIINKILPVLEFGKKDNPFLQYVYGYLAHHGIHFNENHKIASDWYSLATGNNNLQAIYALGKYYCISEEEEDRYKAVEYYKSAAKRGSRKAVKDLFVKFGVCFSEKEKMLEEDILKIVENFLTPLNNDLYLIKKHLDSEKKEKKLDNALRMQRTHGHKIFKDQVIALYDDTLFGAGDDGFLITYSGLAVHNSLDSSCPQIQWDDIQTIRSSSASDSTIIISSPSQYPEIIKFKNDIIMCMMMIFCLKHRFSECFASKENLNCSVISKIIDISKIFSMNQDGNLIIRRLKNWLELEKEYKEFCFLQKSDDDKNDTKKFIAFLFDLFQKIAESNETVKTEISKILIESGIDVKPDPHDLGTFCKRICHFCIIWSKLYPSP